MQNLVTVWVKHQWKENPYKKKSDRIENNIEKRRLKKYCWENLSDLISAKSLLFKIFHRTIYSKENINLKCLIMISQ